MKLETIDTKKDAEAKAARAGGDIDAHAARPIVAAVDDSATSPAAIGEAVRIAAELDAPLVFVYVRRGPSGFFGEPVYQQRLSTEMTRARRVLGAAYRRVRTRSHGASGRGRVAPTQARPERLAWGRRASRTPCPDRAWEFIASGRQIAGRGCEKREEPLAKAGCPAILAKQGASLDVLSGGRFELGLGAGAFWEAIGAMGGPVRSGREALRALEEAVAIIRAFWSGERTIAFEGEHYAVRGLHPGPPPAHRIEIWLGVGKPRSLALTGRLADGWCPRIRRVYNVSGAILDESTRGRLEGPPEHWVETLTRFATELGFDTFVFWPSDDHRMQLERFAQEVIPELRQNT